MPGNIFSEIYQLTGYLTLNQNVHIIVALGNKRDITKDIMHYGLLGA